MPRAQRACRETMHDAGLPPSLVAAPEFTFEAAQAAAARFLDGSIGHPPGPLRQFGSGGSAPHPRLLP
jgi:hypothetical protein